MLRDQSRAASLLVKGCFTELTSGIASGSGRGTSWRKAIMPQRERMVGSSAEGRSVRRKMCVRGCGSSRVLRNLLAEAVFMRSAWQMRAIFLPPAVNGDWLRVKISSSIFSVRICRLFEAGAMR